MTYDATDRKHIRQQTKAAKLAEQQRRQIIVGIMSVAPGRAYVCDLLVSCHLFSTSFNGDALRSAFAEGERNVGLRIFNDIVSACPDEYVLMMREANERDTTDERRRAKAGRDGDDSGSVDGIEGDSYNPADGDDADGEAYGREISS